MKKKTELETIKCERELDTEWLGKYRRIVGGLMQIAEIQADACNHDVDEWSTMYHGLSTIAKLMQEDIDGRKEDEE